MSQLGAKGTAAFPGVDVWVAAPYTLIPGLAALKSPMVKVGAQAVSANTGAHTGEVSAAMAKSVGATFTIVGHSERRAQGESDAAVYANLQAALAQKLIPVLCVGESERDPNGAHFEYIENQLTSALRGFNKASKLVIAYEPVWAIGKSAGDAMKPADLQEMHIFIRKTLTAILGRAVADTVSIIYGGSVEAENAASLLEEGGVSGFLVGHASATPNTFIDILSLCKKTLRVKKSKK
ncbi:MAG: triosephosphate isomerase [Candidatus Adlerbacteria bacterium]|nr:triosephosphate isomerase [Candidatus Adlerbacteria bacterium]